MREYREFMLKAVDSLVLTGACHKPSTVPGMPVILMERTDLVVAEADAATDNSSLLDGSSSSSPEHFPPEAEFDETEYRDDGISYDDWDGPNEEEGGIGEEPISTANYRAHMTVSVYL